MFKQFLHSAWRVIVREIINFIKGHIWSKQVYAVTQVLSASIVQYRCTMFHEQIFPFNRENNVNLCCLSTYPFKHFQHINQLQTQVQVHIFAMFKETKTLGNWPLMKNQLHSCRCIWTALHGGLCWSSASSVVLLKSGHSFAASTMCVNCSVSRLYFSFSSFVDTHDCPAGYSYHIVWSVVCTPTYSAQ